MRILIVTDTTGYMRGGVPAVTRELIRGLAARGHTVGLCGDIPLVDDPSVRHFPISFPPKSSLPDEIRAAILAFHPDFVHVMSMSSRGVFALIPILAGRAWLLTCHSIPPYERKLFRFHRYETIHYGLRNARYAPNTLAWMRLFRQGKIPEVVVHSVAVGKTAEAYGQDVNRTTLISLGCDVPEEPRPGSDFANLAGPSIVTTGGIAHTKGYHDAIAALATVKRAFTGVRYQIIGEVRDNSYIGYLHQLVERLGLQATVFITPDLPEEAKNEALDNADLYLQPSHEEGFCLAYIEAALRVPRLVGTDTGAIRLISEGDAAARVAPIKSPVQLAAAIVELLSNQLAPDTMPERYRRLKTKFSWNGYLDAHESLYARILDRVRAGT